MFVKYIYNCYIHRFFLLKTLPFGQNNDIVNLNLVKKERKPCEYQYFALCDRCFGIKKFYRSRQKALYRPALVKPKYPYFGKTAWG